MIVLTAKKLLGVAALGVLLGLAGCTGSGVLGGPSSDDDDDDDVAGDDDDDDDDDDSVDVDAGVAEQLASTFRIDLSEIEVGLDFIPGAATLLGEATLRFRMRPGQTVPLFHFDPAADLPLEAIASLLLDGEPLDPQDPADLRIVSLPGLAQPALEPQRELDPNAEHLLELTWEAANWWDDVAPGWLFTDVSDIAGEGNEVLFPTVNSPDALARHLIELRIHSDTPYRVIGSGLVSAEPPEPGLQRWTLDTERAVASITVLLVAAPADEVIYEERTLGGVPVRIASITAQDEVEQAFDDAGAVLQLLAADFGPLPMARGLSILLMTDYGGGMEYFGGTITDGWALQHELVHMYFGTSTVARTWRDSWWDEAINVWYLWPDGFTPVGAGFSSDIVSGRTPVQPSFDLRAYDEGAAVFELAADRVGGRGALVQALASIRDQRSFSPFTTGELINSLEAETGVDLRSEFGRWVYGQ